MANNAEPAMDRTAQEDRQVFDKLAQAGRLYEEYLAVIQNASVFLPDEALVVPPSPDLPLSLTIWRDK